MSATFATTPIPVEHVHSRHARTVIDIAKANGWGAWAFRSRSLHDGNLWDEGVELAITHDGRRVRFIRATWTGVGADGYAALFGWQLEHWDAHDCMLVQRCPAMRGDDAALHLDKHLRRHGVIDLDEVA